jgi:hypothetical protein
MQCHDLVLLRIARLSYGVQCTASDSPVLMLTCCRAYRAGRRGEVGV